MLKKLLIGVLLVGLLYLYFKKPKINVEESLVKKKPKNVVVIYADDIGYNDVSYHGSNEFATFNIDALAYNGVILDRYYTPPLCTPSRSSMMTGKYAHHIGMQHKVVFNDSPFGLGLDEKIMPQYFKDAGYNTHMIGKWHLGFYQPQYWPTRRGFDSFFGYMGTCLDYFDHTLQMLHRNYSRGHDLKRNFDEDRSYDNEYATDVFTKEAVKVIENHDEENPLFMVVAHLAIHSADEAKPLQAKKEDIERFMYIEDEDRRTLAAMLYSLDQSVGEIVTALTKKGLMEDTIIVFMSDNGGPTAIADIHPTGASNYPLRGEKGFAWEGGIRVPGIIYAPFLPSGVIRKDLFHVSDFLPTLASLANADYKVKSDIDGLDLSKMVTSGEGIKRTEIEVIEEIFGMSGLILNGYKYVNGTALEGRADGWLGTNDHSDVNNHKYFDEVLNSKVGKSLKKFNPNLKSENMRKIRENVKVKCLGIKTECEPGKAACLFDIDNDPCEENNLANTHRSIMKEMTDEINRKYKLVVPSRFVLTDERSDPKYHDYTWTWWQQDNEDHLKINNEL